MDSRCSSSFAGLRDAGLPKGQIIFGPQSRGSIVRRAKLGAADGVANKTLAIRLATTGHDFRKLTRARQMTKCGQN